MNRNRRLSGPDIGPPAPRGSGRIGDGRRDIEASVSFEGQVALWDGCARIFDRSTDLNTSTSTGTTRFPLGIEGDPGLSFIQGLRPPSGKGRP